MLPLHKRIAYELNMAVLGIASIITGEQLIKMKPTTGIQLGTGVLTTTEVTQLGLALFLAGFVTIILYGLRATNKAANG